MYKPKRSVSAALLLQPPPKPAAYLRQKELLEVRENFLANSGAVA